MIDNSEISIRVNIKTLKALKLHREISRPRNFFDTRLFFMNESCFSFNFPAETQRAK